MGKSMQILFEITTSHGTSLVSTFRYFPEGTPDKIIQAEYDQWREHELADLEGGWSQWGK